MRIRWLGRLEGRLQRTRWRPRGISPSRLSHFSNTLRRYFTLLPFIFPSGANSGTSDDGKSTFLACVVQGLLEALVGCCEGF